jgi:NDP-sugar pyrophosphorylase family protein
LAKAGVEEVVYSIGHGGDQIRRHVGDGARFGVTVVYVDEGTDLRGTGGALRMALDAGVLRAEFAVLYGDSLLQVDLADVVRQFEASGAPALMTVYRNDGALEDSNATFDGFYVRYDKHHAHPTMCWVDYGLSIMTAGVVGRIPSEHVADLADLFHDLGESGELAGYAARERFYEIGRPDSLAELNDALRTGQVTL